MQSRANLAVRTSQLAGISGRLSGATAEDGLATDPLVVKIPTKATNVGAPRGKSGVGPAGIHPNQGGKGGKGGEELPCMA
jgi:hypothetical protein